MFAAAMELIFWVLWDLVFSFVFYFTGAVLIRIFSFGKTKYPLAPATFYSTRRQRDKQSFDRAFISGFVFYVALLCLAIWLA